MTEIKAVVFDLGGTLIEYTGDYSSWPELETPGMLAAYAYLDRQRVSLPGTESFIRAGQAILPGRWLMATAGERNLTLPSFLEEMLATLKVEAPDAGLIEVAADRYE